MSYCILLSPASEASIGLGCLHDRDSLSRYRASALSNAVECVSFGDLNLLCEVRIVV